jgi:hypothetical protein
MPAGFQVRASVVDIRTDVPTHLDAFFVDTNVWFWTTYSNVSFSSRPPRYYQTTLYPQYLQAALANGSTLYWLGIQLSELAHRIEKTELEIYNAATATSLNMKQYRHDLPHERTRVAGEIQAAWNAVVQLAPLTVPITIDANETALALQDLLASPLDVYDIFAIRALRSAGVSKVISDDGDFCVVSGITLFTANNSVLVAAQAQGKLLQR